MTDLMRDGGTYGMSEEIVWQGAEHAETDFWTPNIYSEEREALREQLTAVQADGQGNL